MKTKLRQYRFTTLFFILALGALLVPGLLGVLTSTVGLEKILTEQADRENKINLEVVTEKLVRFFNEPVLELKLLKAIVENSQDPLIGFQNMKNSGHQLLCFERISLVNKGADIIAVWPENQVMLGLDQSGKGFLKRIEQNQSTYFWSGTNVDYYTGKSSIDLIIPMKSGYLAGTVLLSDLQRLIDEMPLKSQAVIGIVDANGSYLAHSDPAMVEQRMKDPMLYNPLDFKSTSMKTIQINQKSYIPYQKEVVGTGWTIVSYYPLERARAPVKHVLIYLGAIQGLALLAIAALLLLMGRILNRQISKIKNFTEKIAEGQYDLTEPKSSFLEMGDILEHFENMAQKVQERESEIVLQNSEISTINRELEMHIKEQKRIEADLKNTRDQLELKVDERTSELTALNEELMAINDELNSTLDRLKKTQQQLLQSEKMAATGRLVAGMSHEISTPIGIAVTGVSYMQKELLEFSQKLKIGTVNKMEFEEFIGDIATIIQGTSKNLDRADSLIKSFKSISVDAETEEKRRFNVKRELKDLFHSLRPLFKNKSHQVHIKCPDALEITSYPILFDQIITNLVMNTIRHGFAEGFSGVIKIAFGQVDSLYQLTYSDNGRGMAPEVLRHIYDPFFTTKRGSEGGAGLGLNLVYNIVTYKLGGEIQCASDLGEGTQFIITFPDLYGD